MIHDVIVIGGIEYKAVSGNGSSCKGCALRGVGPCGIINCAEYERPDRVEAIYKRHYKLSGQTTKSKDL